ncbi:MAG: hypothetical protein COX31_03740 [Candidatus Moranbacteria bacterium CG23_combo_of_CG06-09_8_20_14_all_40_16]|nr:MAG: hypothetical protein COX31_03740 [Candidatus Moranbacteria bacterium CG23_combo_of_CG06-09_8_20_14_all_40_16]
MSVEDCAKKLGEENIPDLLRLDISTTQEQKRLLWTERKQKLSNKLLNSTRKIIPALKTYLTFWRKKGFCEEAEKFGIKTGQNIFSLIPFTTDIFAMPKKFMKVSTSQSSQRNFLIKSKKF